MCEVILLSQSSCEEILEVFIFEDTIGVKFLSELFEGIPFGEISIEIEDILNEMFTKVGNSLEFS